jgi:hypothetical protein
MGAIIFPSRESLIVTAAIKRTSGEVDKAVGNLQNLFSAFTLAVHMPNTGLTEERREQCREFCRDLSTGLGLAKADILNGDFSTTHALLNRADREMQDISKAGIVPAVVVGGLRKSIRPQRRTLKTCADNMARAYDILIADSPVARA